MNGQMTSQISSSNTPKHLTERELIKAGIYKRYYNLNFDNIHVKEANKEAFNEVNAYADNFGTNRDKGLGLILKGGVGTGKTTLAIATMKRAMEQGFLAYFIPMVSLMDKFFTMRSDEEREKWDRMLKTVPLLVLDDLGAEYMGKDGQSSFVLTHVDAIISERVNRMNPIIITTNLSLVNREDITDKSSIMGRYNSRILDRLRSTCKLITISGKSIRKEEWR